MSGPMLDPHLQNAVKAEINRNIMLPAQMQVLYCARFVPGQAGTTLCACFDPVGRRVTDPADPVCFGTGVVGGYAGAVQMPLCIYPGAASITQQTPAGYLQTETVDVAYLPWDWGPLKRDDLLIVSPDALEVPGNPDRRYTVGDEMNPLNLGPEIIVRRYYVYAVELGAPVYWVTPPNLTAVPDSRWGTV